MYLIHSVCPGLTKWKLLAIWNAPSGDGEFGEYSMWNALVSPGLQGLHRHGCCRRPAHMRLQPGRGWGWTPGGPDLDREQNSGGGDGPGKIPEVWVRLQLFGNLTYGHQTLILYCWTPIKYFSFDLFHLLINLLQLYCLTYFLNRIYQFARLNYTLKATSSKPETHQFHDMDSGNSNTLLNLDPENVVFYVGGYPSDFRVSSNVISQNGNI